MNPDTGRIIRVVEGEEMPAGFLRLDGEEAAAAEKLLYWADEHRREAKTAREFQAKQQKRKAKNKRERQNKKAGRRG